jgi:hypothetical protein
VATNYHALKVHHFHEVVFHCNMRYCLWYVRTPTLLWFDSWWTSLNLSAINKTIATSLPQSILIFHSFFLHCEHVVRFVRPRGAVVVFWSIYFND